jgi:peroxiredoxin
MLNMASWAPTKKLLLFAAVLGLVIMLVAGLWYAGSWPEEALPKAGAMVGGPAPDFILPDRYGRQLSLSQFRGQNILLVFWASWCPPCRAEMASLQRLHDNPAIQNLKVIAVNIGETGGQVTSFANREQLSLPILLGAGSDVQERYGVYQLPLAFLVDGRGRIIGRHLGLRDWNSSNVITELNQLGGE